MKSKAGKRESGKQGSKEAGGQNEEVASTRVGILNRSRAPQLPRASGLPAFPRPRFPLIPPHQRSLREDVLIHRLFQLLFRSARRQVERDVQCKEPKEVAMGISRRRARTHVGSLAPGVAALPRPGGQLGLGRNRRLQLHRVAWNIVQEPMHKRASGGIRIVADQGVAPRRTRSTAPCQRRRGVVSVTGMNWRDPGTVLERRRGQPHLG